MADNRKLSPDAQEIYAEFQDLTQRIDLLPRADALELTRQMAVDLVVRIAVSAGPERHAIEALSIISTTCQSCIMAIG